MQLPNAHGVLCLNRVISCLLGQKLHFAEFGLVVQTNAAVCGIVASQQKPCAPPCKLSPANWLKGFCVSHLFSHTVHLESWNKNTADIDMLFVTFHNC